MNVIENGVLVDSQVLHLEDREPLPGDGPVTVSLQRWQDERVLLLARGDVGIRLASTDHVDDIIDDIAAVERIALEFPRFADGRAYSHARVLRDRHGFDGELRAIGDVLRDQVLYMQRCGFDVFELEDEQHARDALTAFAEFSVVYQTAADGEPPVYRRKLG